MDKTIKRLQKQDKRYTRDQNEILNEIKSFYVDLFRENTKIEKFNLNNYLRKYNIKKLNKEEVREMEGYLAIDELGITLRNTKNNKAPGLDGFSFEFLKEVWKDLKFCITRVINDSFDKGLLPLSLGSVLLHAFPKRVNHEIILRIGDPCQCCLSYVS